MAVISHDTKQTDLSAKDTNASRSKKIFVSKVKMISLILMVKREVNETNQGHNMQYRATGKATKGAT